MAQDKCTPTVEKTKQVTAQEVYKMTSETLQEFFQLDMTNSLYEAQDVWDVLVAAAVERVTIETACALLEEAPSPNTVRTIVREMLGDEAAVEQLEARVNELLVARLPKNLLKRARPAAIDVTEIPYHGQYDEADEHIRRSRAKHGTTHFHCFATLYVLKDNRRYTLAITLVRRSDKMVDVTERLIERGKALGLKPRRLYLDRGFDNNGVVAYLERQPFPSIIALTIRGKEGGTRAMLKGRKSYQTTYTRPSTRYGPATFNVVVVCKYSKGRYQRQGIYHFAYIVIGKVKMEPLQIFEVYRRRFGIETSYRLMNTMRARTTSSSITLRLFYVALALLLLNLWSYVAVSRLCVGRNWNMSQ
jgi:putative transposase